MKREKTDAERKDLYNTAICLYQETIVKDTNNKYTLRDHHELAKIYIGMYEFDKSIEHSQTILKLTDKGYYSIKAKERIENIRINRKIIKDQFAKYHNYQAINIKTPSEDIINLAAESLYQIAQSYEEMEDYPKAIRTYLRFVEEYPKHKKSPQAQFQIGNIYFYNL